MNYTIAAFYKFADFPDFADWREPLRAFCNEHDIKGSILLAPEGMNGTMCALQENIDKLFAYIRADERFADITYKVSYADEQPFKRTKIKNKKYIVNIGVDGVSPLDEVGEYVPPEEWNALISDPDVIVIDTRNSFEFDMGTFKNAQDPKTESFGEFPEYTEQNLDPNKHKKVAMFCTGGIRCEKATSYLLQQGFENVYHLQGGILNYLEKVPEGQSLWEGECFVFDERVSVDHQLAPQEAQICYGCYRPLIAPPYAHSEKYGFSVCTESCFNDMTPKQKRKMVEKVGREPRYD